MNLHVFVLFPYVNYCSHFLLIEYLAYSPVADETISSEAVSGNIVNNEYSLMNCIVDGEGRQRVVE